jgi:protein-S-isoprenylcysteine O-methyltransferase Ste14
MLKFSQKVGRVLGLSVFTLMILWQVYLLKSMVWDWVPVIRWLLITCLFLQFWLAYWGRSAARNGAQGWRETLLPLFCAGLPFAVIMPPAAFYPWLWEEHRHLAENWAWPVWRNLFDHDSGFLLGLWLMAFGEVVTILGMMSLKRNFSIMSEARALVKEGLYSWVRHPLYAGEILSMWGNAWFWPSWWNIGGAFLFMVLQSWRASIEEDKLEETFPEYGDYRKVTGRFFPRMVSRISW